MELPTEILIPFLNGLGAVIKHLVPRLPNKWIPVILAIVGTVAACVIAPEVTVLIAIRGFASAAVAVGLHQMGASLLPQK